MQTLFDTRRTFETSMRTTCSHDLSHGSRRVRSRTSRAMLALLLTTMAAPTMAQTIAPAVTEGTTTGVTDTATEAPTETATAATPRLAPRPSMWRDLFGYTGGDLKRLPSKESAAWLALGGIAAAGVRPADNSVSRSLSGAAKLHEPLEPGALLGSTPFQMAGSLATYGIARWTGHRKLAVVGADLFRSQLIAEGLTIGLKQSVRRQRPEGSGFAFPSGHTTVSFASATVLQRHYGWHVGAPAYGIATYVALSRVQMKRHYLSDVAFGAALGIVAGRTVTIGSMRRMQVSPLVTPGAGGVQFTWQGR